MSLEKAFPQDERDRASANSRLPPMWHQVHTHAWTKGLRVANQMDQAAQRSGARERAFKKHLL